MLQCSQNLERLSVHEADWRSYPTGTRAGAAADQAAQRVLHGDSVLRLGEEQCALEQRRLGRRAVATHEVVWLSEGASRLKLPVAKLHNRTALCYCNSVCQALYWIGEVSTSPSACYGALQAGLRILRAAQDISLPNCIALRALFLGWRHLHTQHDAGEFLLHLLAIAHATHWEARLTNPYRVHDSGDPGCPLLLTLPGESLQGLIDAWHGQYAVHALTQHTGCLFLQICRYSSHTAKNQQYLAVRPGTVVALPVFTEGGDACTRLEPFRVIAVVFHLGPTVTSGHYQTLLGVPADNDWTLYVCDDNRKPRKATNKDLSLVDHNAYLVGLLRCP